MTPMILMNGAFSKLSRVPPGPRGWGRLPGPGGPGTGLGRGRPPVPALRTGGWDRRSDCSWGVGARKTVPGCWNGAVPPHPYPAIPGTAQDRSAHHSNQGPAAEGGFWPIWGLP